MVFLFSIGDERHSLTGDLASVRRQFNELTANANKAAVTPRQLALRTREKLELQEARHRAPNDFFNLMTDVLEPVIDDNPVPVANALPLPKMFESFSDHLSGKAPQQTANAQGEMPLPLPQTFESFPKAPTAITVNERTDKALSLPKLF
jgi:hypothetical protein